MLVVARTIQGVFAALLTPSVLALMTTTFRDPIERGKAFGICGAIAGVAALVPVIGIQWSKFLILTGEMIEHRVHETPLLRVAGSLGNEVPLHPMRTKEPDDRGRLAPSSFPL
jgi:MFS family permease